MTWMELAIGLVPDMTDGELDAILPDIVHHHQVVSTRMASHLSLTCGNIGRSTWMSARMLSKKPEEAREGARLFLDRLIRLAPGAGTSFERAWMKDPVKMRQLHDFAAMEPACLLWHHGGAFEQTFIFLCDR